mgnify:CR=1 FL=1
MDMTKCTKITTSAIGTSTSTGDTANSFNIKKLTPVAIPTHTDCTTQSCTIIGDCTSTCTPYIATIDSDYIVKSRWLSDLVPHFTNPQVALVQAPQDYRDAHESLFKTLCFEEYATFFQVGMVERNESNAIIQHGTMCVVRRSALEEVKAGAGRVSELAQVVQDIEKRLETLESDPLWPFKASDSICFTSPASSSRVAVTNMLIWSRSGAVRLSMATSHTTSCRLE